jgi:AraC family transcriptional regulator
MRIDSAGIRFGTVLKTRDVGSFRLRESRYPGSLVTPVHDHAEPYFSFVVRGPIGERGPRREALYSVGSLHFHPSGDPHSAWTPEGGATTMSVTPHGRIALRLDARTGWPDREESVGLAARARRCYREFHAGDTASDLALEALCLELVAFSLRSMSGGRSEAQPRWLHEAREFLHAHLDRPVAMSELASVARVHPSHLARGFRRHLGCSPGAYLRHLRIERAREALPTSDLPIVTLALEAGFASQAHFTRAFHRSVGLPPGAYRKLHGRSG